MKKKFTSIAAAGAIGLAGVTSVVVVGSALAPASAVTTEEDTGSGEERSFLDERLARIKEALSGLVGDGTITQEQADRVADTLGESDALGPRGGHGGPGGFGGGHHGRGFGAGIGLEAAAETLGIPEDELRGALAEGSTLAEVAEQRNVALDTLVSALVAAGTERLDEALADGRIGQEQYDERVAELPERVADAVERELPRWGGGHGWHGRP